MTMLLNVLRVVGIQSRQPIGDSGLKGGFKPLNSTDLARVQRGFDEETDPDDGDVFVGGEETVLEPVSGEIVDDQLDGV